MLLHAADVELEDALALLQKWYKEGFLDPEFPAKDPWSKAPQSIINSTCGLFFGAEYAIEWPLPDSIKNDPEADWTFGDVPAGPGGKRGRLEPVMNFGLNVVSSGHGPKTVSQ